MEGMSQGLPSVSLEQVVQRYRKKFNDGYLDELAKQLKLASSEFRNNFKKIPFMIGGLSCLQDISIHYRLDFEYDYPEQESDEDADDMDVPGLDPDSGGQAALTKKRPRQRVFELSDEEPKDLNPQKPPTTMEFNSVVRVKPHISPGFKATLMKRMTTGPPFVGRYTPVELEKMLRKRTDGKHINIPKLQVELYKEFEHAIQYAIDNKSNQDDVKFNLIKQLFVKIQRRIRNFYITATPNEPKYKYFPHDYDTYIQSTHHYFDFFRRCFKLAQELRINGTQPVNIEIVVRFLCRSVFIRLDDIQINAVVEFIFQLLSIADEVNAPGLTEENRKTTIIKNLTPVIERISKNKSGSKDPLNNVFFSYIINDYPEYIWLQALILGKVIVTDEEFQSKKGGIRKKVNHTNKYRKSRHNKHSKRNRKSRRNKQRT